MTEEELIVTPVPLIKLSPAELNLLNYWAKQGRRLGSVMLMRKATEQEFREKYDVPS